MNRRYFIILLAFIAGSTLVAGQGRTAWVAAKSGLSIREKPAIGAKVLDKIPYGTKITIQYTEEELVSVVTEGMHGYWEKVMFNNKTGYIVGSYLLPVAPPKLAVVKEMKDYFKQVYVPFGNKLVVKEGRQFTIEGGYELHKQLYKNGAEWHRFMGYEYGSDTWFLPDFTLEDGFILMRLIPEFRDVFGEKEEFPSESRTFKKGEREYTITVEKELIGEHPWIKQIHISYGDDAIYEVQLYQLDNQLVIFFGSGL